MKTKQGLFPIICLLLFFSSILAQDQKPNFSGTWAINREKSEFGARNGDTERRPGGDVRDGEGGKQPREGSSEGDGGRRPRGGMFDSMTI